MNDGAKTTHRHQDGTVYQGPDCMPGETSATPVADALQAVDSASRELDAVRDAGEDDEAAESAHLDALLALADAVRSHGIGADLGVQRDKRGQAVEVGLIREGARSHHTRYYTLRIAPAGTMVTLTQNHSGQAQTFALEAGERLAVAPF